MTKRQFKKQVRACLKDSMKVLDHRLNTLLKSGAIDLPSADMVTCKAATVAFLASEAAQFYPRTVKHRNFIRKVNNMRANM